MSKNNPAPGHIFRRVKALWNQYLLVLHIPIAWMKSIMCLRPLLAGQWGNYMGFRPKNALNSLFYRTQWLNIRRYGRYGCSPVLGLGEFPLSRWFHISTVSHGAYANAGAVTMLGGTIGWALMHLSWLGTTEWWWALIITTSLLLSTTTYAMAFVRQNYNILGWVWLPLALFAVASEQWFIAAFAWFAASLASITVVFVALPLMLVQSTLSNNIEATIVLLPAIGKVGLHIVPLLVNGSFIKTFTNLGKIIGLIPTRIRYRRLTRKFGRYNTFFAVLYFSACAFSWFLNGVVPAMPILAAIIFVVNQRFFRFADDQSVVILFLSVFAAYTLEQEPGAAALAILIMVANPIPALLGIVNTDDESGRNYIATFVPFDHTGITRRCDNLFGCVRSGDRILFAFEDPGGTYENIFDGYRNAIEPLLYVAACRDIHLFPDWHAVQETNTTGDFHIWGRSRSAVKTNVAYWNADFVLYYMASEDELSETWLEEYQMVGCFDYAPYLVDLGQALPWSAELPCPKFVLLKPLFE